MDLELEMKFGWLIVAAIGAIAQITSLPALAADFPPAPSSVKAPVVAPAYNWSGCYVGVNGGYGWNPVSRTYNDPNATQDPINGLGGLATILTPTSGNGGGGLGGIEAGCNWEGPQRLVYGIEGDFDFANIRLSQTTSGPNGVFYQTGTGQTFAPNSNYLKDQITQNWLSTIRGRIGYAVQDRLLLFATGGLAIGQVQNQGSVNLQGLDVWSGSSSTVHAGYTLGGGAEWAFVDHWTAKAEYLWYDLGNTSHPLSCVANGVACGGNMGYPTLGNVVSSVRGSILRVGLNYKFSGP
jgi:outer membrane immunogenic protein